MFKPIVVIPFFNHSSSFKRVVPGLKKLKLPVLVINDGSSMMDTKRLNQLCLKNNFYHIKREQNGGKGVAVKEGLNWAISKGYSHALQIDADGQHNLDDISDFLNLSKKYPDHIITAQPIYDQSAPKSRLYGRKITNFWVYLETAGRFKMDTMCGFRVYPLEKIRKILPCVWFNRMGFDVEILVKSFLNHIAIIGKPTKIIYQKNGISHFRPLKDNFEISCVHACLCVYSLWRFLTHWRRS